MLDSYTFSNTQSPNIQQQQQQQLLTVLLARDFSFYRVRACVCVSVRESVCVVRRTTKKKPSIYTSKKVLRVLITRTIIQQQKNCFSVTLCVLLPLRSIKQAKKKKRVGQI